MHAFGATGWAENELIFNGQFKCCLPLSWCRRPSRCINHDTNVTADGVAFHIALKGWANRKQVWRVCVDVVTFLFAFNLIQLIIADDFYSGLDWESPRERALRSALQRDWRIVCLSWRALFSDSLAPSFTCCRLSRCCSEQSYVKVCQTGTKQLRCT